MERDWFRCQYCGRNWKDVTLEVDHIIPKAKWWSDDFNNLITCCRECNVGKGNREIGISNWDARMLEDDLRESFIKLFFKKWNDKRYWSIADYNVKFVVAYIKVVFDDSKEGEKLDFFIDVIHDKYWDDMRSIVDVDKKVRELREEYNKWGKLCEKALEKYKIFIEEYMINEIYDYMEEDGWNTDDMNRRLNYTLSRFSILKEYYWLAKKYTLYPKQIKEWQKEM